MVQSQSVLVVGDVRIRFYLKRLSVLPNVPSRRNMACDGWNASRRAQLVARVVIIALIKPAPAPARRPLGIETSTA